MGFTVRPLSLSASRSQDGDSGSDTANPSAIWLPEIAWHASSANSHGKLNTPPVYCQGLVEREYVVTPI
jgi:hypothetical protein